MSQHLTDSESEDLAVVIAQHLKDKAFEKHPHIALLGPKPKLEPSLISSKLLTAPAQPEEDELLSDKMEERSSERIVPYVTGFRAGIKQLNPNNSLSISYSFFVRVAPPDYIIDDSIKEATDCFRHIIVHVTITNGKQVTCRLSVSNTAGTQIYSEQIEDQLIDGSWKISAPDVKFQGATNHLATLKLPFALMRRYEEEKQSGKGRTKKIERIYRSDEYVYSPSFTIGLVLKKKVDTWELIYRLTNSGGWMSKRTDLLSPVEPNLGKDFRRQAYDSENKSWSLGVFMEVKGTLQMQGFEKGWKPTGKGITGLHTINSVYQEEGGLTTFQDYALDKEAVPSIPISPLSPEEVIRTGLSELTQTSQPSIDSRTSNTVSSALHSALLSMKIKHLYVFQEDCTRKILSSLGQEKVIIIAARTASGKTLAFVLPISAFCYSSNLLGGLPGVKALLFYPTKALCHDQADTILQLLWHTNRYLKDHGIGGYCSVGILHGNTYSDYEVLQAMEKEGPHLEKELRYKCPECGSRLIIEFDKEQIAVSPEADEAVYSETGTKISWKISCSGRENPNCILKRDNPDPASKALIDFLNSMLRPTRVSIYGSPPDILIATPDMISLKLLRDPNQGAMFGRSIFRCNRCGRPSSNSKQKKCGLCKTKLPPDLLKFSYPSIVVFDDAHQLRGSFGAQVSYVVSRLHAAVRSLNSLESYNPLLVFSSATFNDPKSFLRGFLGTRESHYDMVSAEPAKTSLSKRNTNLPEFTRSHLFIMPKGYSPNATLSKVIQKCFEYFVTRKSRYPNILVFANQLSITSELINEMENSLFDFLEERGLFIGDKEPVVDGHSTDWGRARADVEDRFSKGEINVLVATRGLEVGVDFDRIDILILFGSPFYVSDYLQRIGRSARKHSALAVSIQLEKPIDFFFLRNFRLISDISIRDEALQAEDSSVTRDNSVIYQRTLARAVLDYLCLQEDAYTYYYRKIKGGAKGVRDNLKVLFSHLFDDPTTERYLLAYFDRTEAPPSRTETVLNQDLVSYVRTSVGEKAETQRLILDTVVALVERIDKYAKEGTLGNIIMSKAFSKRFSVMDLRGSDSNVIVSYEDLQSFARKKDADEYTRPRKLGLAVGHYSPGQLSSFRGLVHIVTRVDGNESENAAVKELIYKGEEDTD